MRRAAQAAKKIEKRSNSFGLESRASNMARSEPSAASSEPPWPPATESVFRDWERFERYPNYLAAQIVAGLLEGEGVPTIIEGITPLTGFETSALWVPKKLVHRARWVLAWAPPTDAELIFLATGEFPDA